MQKSRVQIIVYACCLLLMLQTGNSYGQFGNEWINFSNTYYKFKIGKDGLYRINQSTLNAVGLGAANAESFQLWKNGVQIPLYVSKLAGPLNGSDYIEFWGTKNDGKFDRNLYFDKSNFINDQVSLQTDTASYFLTVNTNPSIPNLRITQIQNQVSSNTLPAEKYFIHPLRINFTNKINRGFAQNVSQDVYSSTYDEAEMFSSNDIFSNAPLQVNLPNLFIEPTGPKATLITGLAGNAAKNRVVNTYINNTKTSSKNYSQYNVLVDTISNINLSTLVGNGTDIVKIENTNINDQYDRVIANFIELQYPRSFDFSGQSNMNFSLKASNSGYYLVIKNFNFTSGNQAPVLYNLTNRTRLEAYIASNTQIEFVIPPISSACQFVLVDENTSNITNINTLQNIQFTNYSMPTNQGDYLIISGKVLSASVNLYSAYRASQDGGNYKTKIYDIDELVDQFAYGIKKHPLAIKNFVKYAKQYFPNDVKAVLLIGKGTTYDQYRFNESSPYADLLNLVPTFGWPASDALLVSPDLFPLHDIPVGRISVVNNQELLDYLDKVKDFESLQKNANQTIAERKWMKDMVQVNGADANDPGLKGFVNSVFDVYKNMLTPPRYGANITRFEKDNSGVTTITNQKLTGLFNAGFSLFTYFGHSASSTLGYNLDDPSNYDNGGRARCPMFLVNGCDAGNFYEFDTGRLTSKNALAEIWVLAPSRKGAMGFVASSHLGLTTFLDAFTRGFSSSLANNGLNKGVGYNVINGCYAVYPSKVFDLNSYFPRIHAEEMLLHGDPVIKIFTDSIPDYDIEDPQVVINPSFISIAKSSFDVKMTLYNLGRATTDSVPVLVLRTYPNGQVDTIFNQKRFPLFYADSLSFTLPIIGTRDKGTNTITITIDPNNTLTEKTKANNNLVKSFVIYEDEISPIYPYNFGVVNTANAKLYASTADPLSESKSYIMQIDTTSLFNSSSMVSKVVNNKGGLVEFDPGITYVPNTVYYWRVAINSINIKNWNMFSFVYLNNTSLYGYNQSHTLQHTASYKDGILLDSNSGVWNFAQDSGILNITHSIFPTSGSQPSDFQVKLNDVRLTANACIGKSIIFNLLDPITLKPYLNQPIPATTASGSTFGGFMGSAMACTNGSYSERNFEFRYIDSSDRRKIKEFMQWIPSGTYVIARLILDQPFASNPYSDAWKNDRQVYGNGNTMYDAFLQAGFTDIDSIVSSNPRTFALVYKKDDNSFMPQSHFSKGLTDQIKMSVILPYRASQAVVVSPKFGPATNWSKLIWEGQSTDATNTDSVTIQILGVRNNLPDTLLGSYSGLRQNLDISQISATRFPYLKLKMYTSDTINRTAYQLKYWRLLGSLVPEGALSAQLLYSFNNSDTLQYGEPLQLSLAFKNVSPFNFSDSIPVFASITDASNTTRIINLAKLKPLATGDTSIIRINLDSKSFSGVNTLYCAVNPNYMVPEEFLFNNFFYKKFTVASDVVKPTLQVTFDGNEILNGDYVSSKPNIRIKLKDNSKFVSLNDTSEIKVQLAFPTSGTSTDIRSYKYDNDTLVFTPANLNNQSENIAYADFRPYLPIDGTYQLIVSGKDKSNNASGSVSYTINFKVNNKPQISNLFNYPNPFTSSTAFVFTLTGSQVPSTFRIQILTITGKVVREINKDELGDIHIGTNITKFKWDGTDMYGDKLANGVYLYRVIANTNGNAIDKFTPFSNGQEVNTDQYFKEGYGKMYLMR